MQAEVRLKTQAYASCHVALQAASLQDTVLKLNRDVSQQMLSTVLALRGSELRAIVGKLDYDRAGSWTINSETLLECKLMMGIRGPKFVDAEWVRTKHQGNNFLRHNKLRVT